ncbi:MAG: hypothetical protein K0Q87_189 [Neobacillus sp.]|jgi:hypothetical protein|nr:hypothetical protein [Neobacillus sp.]
MTNTVERKLRRLPEILFAAEAKGWRVSLTEYRNGKNSVQLYMNDSSDTRITFNTLTDAFYVFRQGNLIADYHFQNQLHEETYRRICDVLYK